MHDIIVTGLMYIFLVAFCIFVPVAFIWLLVRRVRYVINAVRELRQYWRAR